MAAPPKRAGIGGVKGRPEFGVSSGRKLKALGQNPNDGKRDTTEHNSLTDDILFAPISLLPGGVTENYGLRCLRQIFTSTKITAKHGSHAQGSKETIAHASCRDWFCTRRLVQQIAGDVVNVQRGEDSVELFPVEIVGIGQVGARKQADALSYHHELR